MYTCFNVTLLTDFFCAEMSSNGDPEPGKLFVSGLHRDVDEKQLELAFARFGQIREGSYYTC